MVCAFSLFLFAALAPADKEQTEALLSEFTPAAQVIASTVPANGDQNPYGIAFVPEGFHPGGPLRPNDILVSNFNDSANQQGTGTTIVRITPNGQQLLFFEANSNPQSLVGLTTALGALKSGFVLVGNVPTDASGAVHPGSLLVVNRFGTLVATLTSGLDSPWDLAVVDNGVAAQVFVSNVLSGTVTRLDIIADVNGNSIQQVRTTQIASGYVHRLDPTALVIGPTGLAYNFSSDTLFVASTGDNKVFAVANARSRNTDAGTGRIAYQDDAHLHGPLGLSLAPNGNLIAANGDAVNPGGTQNALVEFTRDGVFVSQFQIDPGAAGGAFGIALDREGNVVRFAAVDDDQNTLNVWNVH